MAEEAEANEKEFQVFDLNDASLETTYVNTTHAIIGEGEVTLYFGFQPTISNNIPACNPTRITMTHDSFMRMMEYWAARYRFLETLYGGKPVTLRDADAQAIDAAFDVMFGRTNKETEQDETSISSTDSADAIGPSSGK